MCFCQPKLFTLSVFYNVLGCKSYYVRVIFYLASKFSLTLVIRKVAAES